MNKKSISEVTSLFAEGLALHQAGRLEDAEKIYLQILATQPDHFDSLHWLGVIFLQRGNHAEAASQIELALRRNPNNILALNNRGVTLHKLKRFEEALASYDRALALRPDLAETLSNRGGTLHELKRYEEALASYDRALALRPDYAGALYSRGNPLHELKRYEEALASYDRALALRPDHAETLLNRGATLHELERYEEALASYDRALALRPDYAGAHFNEALCRLLIGDFGRGWEKFQCRFVKRNFAQPVWVGSCEIGGKAILLHAEESLGDTIQFCRYVPLVAERAARVILEVQAPLHGLMSTLPVAAQIVSRGDPLPDFDIHCPLHGLPLALGTRLATIPSATPYLRASSQAVMNWNAWLGPRDRPRIGLAWSGNPKNNIDHKRSMRLSSLLSLLDINATFVSLQTDVRAGDAAVLKARSDLHHFGDELKDFSDTAALISNLDLVISVDTSVVHLAGALAKSVWVLLPFIPDWRWLLDREDSPWYPTARLFRQDDSRAWDNVITSVHAALHDFVRNYCSRRPGP
jgi:tetratricopeptide (TPR) repeat protein